MAPNLALTYNSSGGNGILGVGWNLELGSIQRSTKRGVNYNPNETDSDADYIISGSSGELVRRGDLDTNCLSSETAYGNKIEGAFSRYCKTSSNSWIVTTKDGTKYYYGKDPYTQYEAKQDNTYGTFKWCLVRAQDTNGNYMTVTYTKAYGEIYLDEIKYTGNEMPYLAPTNSVKFSLYEPRTDAPDMYITNSKVTTVNRLKQIDVYANGSLVRKYVLEYDTDLNVPVYQYSHATGRSLLTKVTQYGTDGSALPPVTLTYQNEDSTYMQYSMWHNGPINGSNTGIDSDRCIAGDFDGNGRTDLACYDAYPSTWRMAMSEGDSWNTQYWPNGPRYEHFLPHGDCIPGDFNGDGKTDITCFDENGTWQMFLSTGSAWDSSQSWGNGPNPTTEYIGTQCTSGDFNGDGKTDLAIYLNGSRILRVYTTNINGNGFNPYQEWPNGPSYGSSFSDRCTTGDFDGDGKTDIACYKEDLETWDMALSTQPGWSSPDWTGFTLPSTPIKNRCTTGDFNGDGKTDFACHTGNGNWRIALSKGNGWDVQQWSNGIEPAFSVGNHCLTGDFNGDGKTDLVYYYENPQSYRKTEGWISLSTGYSWNLQTWDGGDNDTRRCKAGDYNGDGRTDVTCNIFITTLITDPDGSTYYRDIYTNDWHMLLSDYQMPDLLSRVTNILGGTTDISYLPSSSYVNPYLPFVVQTVWTITADDKNGGVNTSGYLFSGGLFDAEDREYRGFEYMSVTYPSGAWSETSFYQDDVKKGLPGYSLSFGEGVNPLVYSGVNYTYEETFPYTGVSYPKLDIKDDFIFDGSIYRNAIYNGTWDDDPSKYLHSALDITYDGYGNVTRRYFYGDVAKQGDERDEYTTYIYDTVNWIFLPQMTYVINSSGEVKARSWFVYYPNTANLEYKQDCLAASTCPSPTPDSDDPKTRYEYYPNGNLWKVYDPKNNAPTVYEYDTVSSTYATQITNALNHQIIKTYDLRFGKVLTKADSNTIAAPTTYYYDIFGRLINATNPNDGLPAYAWKETHHDGLGRAIKTKTGGPDNKVIVTETKYDNRGLVEYTSLPYFENLETPRWTHYEYDPVGRVTLITKPDLTSMTKSYMQGRTTILDADNHKSVQERDIYGRLVKVEEYKGIFPAATLYATTRYEYDTLGNLLKVTDAKNNQTTIAYDTLSRKKSMNDPDMGSWTYTYDANGNLATQTDAKNQTIVFQYDVLNRITKKDYPAGTDVQYYYDQSYGQSCVEYNLIGRLSRVTDVSGEEKYCYDKSGRATKTIKTVNSTDYPVDTEYDELGRVDSIRYPDQYVVNYLYDAGGNIYQVPGFATYGGYNALGQPGTVTYGNGVTTTYTYYPTNNR
ncbi:MAG: FG-GAP-like repeat-containing protein, partial [Thermodesulfovibrionales bacterium]